MTTRNLLQSYEDWSRNGRSLVLATVYETVGSTYSKAGAQMLITDDGRFRGMLSGGCLEGDLAERAKVVAESGASQTVTYDLAANDSELWGLGVGCDGLMRIFLQPLSAENQYEPFATIAKGLQGDVDEIIVTVVASDIDALKPGATLVSVNGVDAFSDAPTAFVADFQAATASISLQNKSSLEKINGDTGAATLLCSRLSPPPSVLVLGAGLDAEPVVRFAAELGWRVTLQDHRSAYIDAGSFDDAEHVMCVPVGTVSEKLDLNRFSAAIVMSHHLTSDRQYLAQLADSRIPFVGLLGPSSRRQKLLGELGEKAADIEDRLQGPVGIDLGGRGPAAIALSIVAGVQQAMLRAD